jgi:hypothetical protein
MPTLFRDTIPEAEAVLFDLLRKASPAHKLNMVNQLNTRLHTLMYAGLRQRFPAAGQDELRRRMAGLLLGEELAATVDAYCQTLDRSFPNVGHKTMADQALEAALSVIAVLERLDIPYVIVGSVASAAYGIARTTQDTDLLAALALDHVAPLVQALHDDYYLSVMAIVEAIQESGSFNLIHLETLFKVDVFIPKPRPFDQAQLQRGRRLVIATDPERTAIVASPEDTIAAKLAWYRAGGELSDNQWRDVLAIVKAQGASLDLAYLRQAVVELGVSDLLERALASAS